MRFLARLLSVAFVCAALSSCETGNKSSGSGPYVSNYGSDGGYNPYPGQPGTIQSSSYSPPPSSSAPPTYTAPPTPASDPYAFNAGSSAPASPKVSSSGSAPKKTTASASKPKAKAPVKRSGSYKVVKGDTLYGIARKRGTTVAKIKSANGLSSDLIRLGQTLKIP
jgi:LysM repeat protein